MTETVTLFPERINVMRVVTYDVEQVIKDMKKAGLDIHDTDDIMEFIEEWVVDDFGSLSGLTWQDENGNEL